MTASSSTDAKTDLTLDTKRRVRNLRIGITSLGTGQYWTTQLSSDGTSRTLFLSGSGTGDRDFVAMSSSYSGSFYIGGSDSGDSVLTLALGGSGVFDVPSGNTLYTHASIVNGVNKSGTATGGKIIKTGGGKMVMGENDQLLSGVPRYQASTYSGGFEFRNGTVYIRASKAFTITYSGTTNVYNTSSTTAFGTGVLTAVGGVLDVDGLDIQNDINLVDTLAFSKSGTNQGRSIAGLGGTIDLQGGTGFIYVDDENSIDVIPDSNLFGAGSSGHETQEEVHIYGKVTNGNLFKYGRRRLYLSAMFDLNGLPNGATSNYSGLTIGQGEVMPQYITSQGTSGPAGTGVITLAGGQLGIYRVATGQSVTPIFDPVATNMTDRQMDVTSDGGTVNIGGLSTNSYTLGMGQLTGTGTLTKKGTGLLSFSASSNTHSGAMTLLNGTLKMASIASSGGVFTLGDSGSVGTAVTFGYTGATASIARNVAIVSSSAVFDVSSSSATLTVSGSVSGTGSLVKSGDGTVSLTGVLSNTGTFSVSAGKLEFTQRWLPGQIAGDNSAGTLTAAGSSLVSVNVTTDATWSTSAYSGEHHALLGVAALNIASGAQVRLAAVDRGSSSAATFNVPATVVTKNIASSISGFLDLANNDMIVRDAAESDIRSLVSNWYSGITGSTHHGIGTSAITNTGTGDQYKTLAVFNNHVGGSPDPGYFSSYDRIAIFPTPIIVKYTWYGDTNLDGVLDGADLANLIEGYSNALTGCRNGDFNYDGVVNSTDIGLYNDAYAGGGNVSLGSGEAVQTGFDFDGNYVFPWQRGVRQESSVPEPGEVGLLAGAVVLGMGRRGRR